MEATKIEVDDSFGKRWFFAGGDWRARKTARISVKTVCAVGSGTEAAPQYWSLRYEIPDGQVSHRQWRTDIGLTSLANQGFQFSLSTAHWILPGYIGEEPDNPLPSAPGIIATLLTSKLWRACAGDQRLTPNVTLVREGRANEFVDRLMSLGRGCPCVLVSKEYATNKPLVDSMALARLLAGTASVYESESTEIDRELEHLLERDYRCWNGRVRVYQPTIRSGDARRHRYFTRDEIQELGSTEIQDRIVRGIARRSQLTLGASVTTLEDVVSRQREERLAQLKKDGESNEFLELYKEEVEDLTGKLSDSKTQAEYWKGQADETGELQDEIRRLEYDKKQLEDRASIAEINAEASEAKSDLIEDMEELPSTVEDVVQLIAKAFHDRVIFTGRALADAKKCKLRDPNMAWKCLRSMATVLYKLHFEGELPFREIVTRYQDSTPFELAVTESETTRRNKKLSSQRKAFYKGKERDFSSHVKYGNSPGNCLRIHYCADPEGKALVVERCVDHLDLMSTN
ncbi:MAG TPA: hypothetical protein VF311_13665 [Terriglobales bacterium]